MIPEDPTAATTASATRDQEGVPVSIDAIVQQAAGEVDRLVKLRTEQRAQRDRLNKSIVKTTAEIDKAERVARSLIVRGRKPKPVKS